MKTKTKNSTYTPTHTDTPSTPAQVRKLVQQALAAGAPAETLLDTEERKLWTEMQARAKQQPSYSREDMAFYVAVDFAFCSPAPTKKESVTRAKQLISRIHQEGMFIDCSPVKATCLGA